MSGITPLKVVIIIVNPLYRGEATHAEAQGLPRLGRNLLHISLADHDLELRLSRSRVRGEVGHRLQPRPRFDVERTLTVLQHFVHPDGDPGVLGGLLLHVEGHFDALPLLLQHLELELGFVPPPLVVY